MYAKLTWSVLRDRKIPLLMFRVEILLSNATNRTRDLWYVEFITGSCHCPTLHFLDAVQNGEQKGGRDVAHLPTQQLPQWPCGARHKATGTCRPAAQWAARESSWFADHCDRADKCMRVTWHLCSWQLWNWSQIFVMLCAFVNFFLSFPCFKKNPKEHCKLLHLCHFTLMT